MDDIFSKRMQVLMQHGSVGAKLVEDSNIIENKTFGNDQNFRTGMLYDWDMNELEEVDFKFEKTKTYTAGGVEVEYMIHFRPDYNPEFKYKDLYYKNDGRQRLGFYIDVLNRSKNTIEKWLIIGKDDRVAFDRYNAYKCNWCFEWITDGEYYNCVGCLRNKSDSSATTIDNDLGGTSVDGDLSIILPSNISVGNIKYGTRFMISDNLLRPQVYEVIKVNDTSPLGVTVISLSQCLYNSHTDVCGVINEMDNYEFCFDLPIEDLPNEYGGKYHMICDCLISKGLPQDSTPTDVAWKLESEAKYIYVHGHPLSIKAIPSKESNVPCEWHIFIDNAEYLPEDIIDYFDISIDSNTLSIKAINKVMEGYIIKVAIYDDLKTYYDAVEMEVRI